MEAIKKSKPTMTMTWEPITPEYAKALLKTVQGNRRISHSVVDAYAEDMRNGKWDSQTGTAISIDEDGILRDGQHRLSAIVKSGCTIRMWVCRGVNANSIYDFNRKRSLRDQVKITSPNLENVFGDTKVQALIKTMINKSLDKSYQITPAQYVDYVQKHKEQLDTFLSKISLLRKAPKIAIQPVFIGIYLAYLNGENLDDIAAFYDILVTGMSDSALCFPIITYRNILLSAESPARPNIVSVSRCQYALKKYLSQSCTKKIKSLPTLIWDFPKETLF